MFDVQITHQLGAEFPKAACCVRKLRLPGGEAGRSLPDAECCLCLGRGCNYIAPVAPCLKENVQSVILHICPTGGTQQVQP